MSRTKIFYIAIFLLSLALLPSFSNAQTATPGFGFGSYCSSFYQNANGAVSNAFVKGVFSGGIVSLALLIVLFVVVSLSVVYGIGIGFGINKLTEFAKTEYIESFFNIVLIIVLAGSFMTIGKYAQFFTSLASSNLPSTSQPNLGGSVISMYEGICTGLIYSQILPSIGAIYSIYAAQMPYSAISSLKINLNIPALTTGMASDFIPSFSFGPWEGLNIYGDVLLFEFAPLAMILFLGISVIFLFYLIYFLFPVFLYLGVLLRSFPWTRAAGGSMLALFISFYIIFPALYYPFSVLGNTYLSSLGSASLQQEICSLMGQIGNCKNYQSPGTFSTIFNYASTLFSNFFTASSSILLAFTGPGNLFIVVSETYTNVIAASILKLLGLTIAFIISFDLLEALGDFLGSPSLQSDRVLSRII